MNIVEKQIKATNNILWIEERIMYCQKCGKQIDEGSVFCQHCGAQIGNSVSDNFSNRNANLNFNVQHTERKTERIKSKEEFMDDYHTKHPDKKWIPN